MENGGYFYQAWISSDPKRHMPIDNPKMEPSLSGHFNLCNVLPSFYSKSC